jgi:hypothetical protein
VPRLLVHSSTRLVGADALYVSTVTIDDVQNLGAASSRLLRGRAVVQPDRRDGAFLDALSSRCRGSFLR